MGRDCGCVRGGGRCGCKRVCVVFLWNVGCRSWVCVWLQFVGLCLCFALGGCGCVLCYCVE